MNPFQLTFSERLREWNELRNSVQSKTTLEQCVSIDDWWQRAPLVNHYLHPLDTHNWPDPWQLLSENEYCRIARGLGICYTMHLIGQSDVQMLEVTDECGDEYIIVACDKYAMNWHPRCVVNTTLSQFTPKRNIDISHLLNKIK